MNSRVSMLLKTLGVAAAAMVAAACVTAPPPPTDAFFKAGAAIEQAERSGAADYAPADLAAAREKLTQAQAESSGSHIEVRGIWLAEEARADAELAGERARAKKAEIAANEVGRSVDALRTETERPTT